LFQIIIVAREPLAFSSAKKGIEEQFGKSLERKEPLEDQGSKRTESNVDISSNLHVRDILTKSTKPRSILAPKCSAPSLNRPQQHLLVLPPTKVKELLGVKASATSTTLGDAVFHIIASAG
jgi:hypothetical protein